MKVPTDQDEICAGFFPRAGAYVADCIFVGILISGYLLIVGAVEMAMPDSFLFHNLLFQYNIFDIITYLLVLMYFVLFLSITGTTPGKRIFNLAVINEKGFKPTFFEALYRESIGRFLSSMLFFGYIMIFIDKRNRAFHDYLCDTNVIYTVKLHRTYKKEKPQDMTYPVNIGMVPQQAQSRPNYGVGMQSQPMNQQPMNQQPMNQQPMYQQPMPQRTGYGVGMRQEPVSQPSIFQQQVPLRPMEDPSVPRFPSYSVVKQPEIPTVSETPTVNEIPSVSETPTVNETPSVSETLIVNEIPITSATPEYSIVKETIDEL